MTLAPPPPTDRPPHRKHICTQIVRNNTRSARAIGDGVEVITQDVEDVERRGVPHPQPDGLGRRAVQEGGLSNVRVLLHDHVVVFTSPRPDLDVGCSIEPDVRDMTTIGILDRQLAKQVT